MLNLFTSTLDFFHDGVILVEDRQKVLYFNEAFRCLWNIPEELSKTLNPQELINYLSRQLKYPQIFIEKIDQIHQSKDEFEDQFCLTDGRIIKRRSKCIEDEAFTNVRLSFFTDITELHKKKNASLFSNGSTKPCCLTPREHEILILIGQGHPTGTIAERLSLSPHTIKGNLKEIYAKLSVNTRTAAIFKARQLGIIRDLDT